MSLVLELQKEALDQKISVSHLLRKALVVARKLKLSEFQEWVEIELNGYTVDVPEYRKIEGACMVKNPYHGYIPIQFPNEKMANRYSRRGVTSTIAELEALIGNRKSTEILTMRYHTEIERHLASQCHGLIPQLVVGKDKISGILDSVRNIVLNWSLKLEEDGIVGEGMFFSDKEKQTASQITNVNYIGQMVGSQLQQGTSNAVSYNADIKMDFEAIKVLIEQLKEQLSTMSHVPEQKAELQAEIATIESQINSPKPKEGIIRETLQSIRRILEGGAGNLLSSQSVMDALGRLISN
ncbi:hypothetical protein [Anaerospora sp.]|uniref:AbiTii domain-containing protein n=1 Tax=Anaerospora sp. TaxID=1960278 RepID=UPI00289BA754|nr:hypothetical protein [Anaerospora sp.]